MKKFFQEAWSRLKQDTPQFFKTLGTIGVSAAAVGGALLAPEVAGAHMPAIVETIASHILTAGAIMKAVSHFAVITTPTDPKA